MNRREAEERSYIERMEETIRMRRAAIRRRRGLTLLADALHGYAEGVEENLRDDDWPNPPSDSYPVVEDYLADADRIRSGQPPLHDHVREVLADETGPLALLDEGERAAASEALASLDTKETT